MDWKNKLVFEKGFDPKKPYRTAKGEGCAD